MSPEEIPETPPVITVMTYNVGNGRAKPERLAPALLASYVTGRVRGVPDLSAASARVAGATVGAALICEGLQATAKDFRKRLREAPPR